VDSPSTNTPAESARSCVRPLTRAGTEAELRKRWRPCGQGRRRQNGGQACGGPGATARGWGCGRAVVRWRWRGDGVAGEGVDDTRWKGDGRRLRMRRRTKENCCWFSRPKAGSGDVGGRMGERKKREKKPDPVREERVGRGRSDSGMEYLFHTQGTEYKYYRIFIFYTLGMEATLRPSHV
jgi:hypothetical protein